jgi:hypothetical protein
VYETFNYNLLMNKAEKDQECDATNAAHGWGFSWGKNAFGIFAPAA